MEILIGDKANKFLEKVGISIANYTIANSLDEIKRKINKFSFPLVIKLISKDAIHKTDVGGVKIVYSEKMLEREFEVMTKNAKKKNIKVDNILLQEFVEGVELIVGLKKDDTFGHVIMLGLGGIYVEVLRDVAFRVCPINEEDALDMINDLKAKGIILSKRRTLNVEELKKTLIKISKIPERIENIVELDINPLMITKKDVKAVDVRIVMD